MTPVDQVLRLLKPLAIIVQNPPGSERMLACAEVLSKYDQSILEPAISLFEKSAKFWPSPSEIIALFENKAEEAEEWWNKILDHIHRKGSYAGPPELPGAARMAMENVGGYYAICMCENDKVTILAKQFKESFKAFKGREEFNQKLLQSERFNGLTIAIGKEMPK